MRPLLLSFALLCLAVPALHGQTSIPPEYRGRQDWRAFGILDGNLIETNFRNNAEMGSIRDRPLSQWPRGTGNRHIDGVAMTVGGYVIGHRAKYPQFFGGRPDTVLNPISLHYFDAVPVSPNGAEIWGWLPLPGFHNPDRRDPITGRLNPTPALSDDTTSWPPFWPDRLGESDPGWAGQWNGLFGRGVFNADLESFYVVDDLIDRRYHLDPATRRPVSPYGVFYADPADSTKGGLGLQVEVRILQWANILAEDAMFILYRITNVGGSNFGETISTPTKGPVSSGLHFTQFADYGLGFEEGDESLAFDPQRDIAYGWDHDGLGTYETGGRYPLGYTGFAFLESPANATDGLDNDEDGITDETRFTGPGQLIQGQNEIRAAVQARYNLANFERFNGPLEEQPAFRLGYWWTGDENLDWRRYDDKNGNNQPDGGELLNDDLGRDGLGPNDLNYPGPDPGEADGMPTPGEPNFDELDVDESDQIGLTGVDLNARPFYTEGEFLADDSWLWERIQVSQFPLGTEPSAVSLDNIEPWLLWDSGPVSLPPNTTDFFSTAWLFGSNQEDFFKNRQIVQQIYNADYRFAQPPIPPRLTAVAGDGRVLLSWDTLSTASFDRFSQEFDFEGYRLYRGTDNLLSDARVITDVNGTPTFWKPLAQWDLRNDVQGKRTVLQGDAVYDLGSNSGLEFAYVDTNVTNGITYYYALVAYDRGFQGPDLDAPPIDPQENTFNISVDQAGILRGHSPNAAVVTPRSRAAGFVGAGANEDLSRVTGGIGTGRIEVTVIDEANVDPTGLYRITFFDSLQAPTDLYETTGYEIRNLKTNRTVVPRTTLVDRTPMVDGFVIDIFNETEVTYDRNRTGWVQGKGSASEQVSLDPRRLDGYETNWIAAVRLDETVNFVPTPYDYELTWADSLYQPPRFFAAGILREPIPVWARNATTGQPLDLLPMDVNGTRTFDAGDELILVDRASATSFKFRHRVRFTPPQGEESVPPAPGDVLRIAMRRPFATGDFFDFTMRRGGVDQELARTELDRVAVVPNPYVATAAWEPRSQITGRGERLIRFIHLPERCTIRIYTMRGELVKVIEHDSFSGDGDEAWDLQTEGGQDVAYGVYLFHVNAPDLGEKTGKFAVVK